MSTATPAPLGPVVPGEPIEVTYDVRNADDTAWETVTVTMTEMPSQPGYVQWRYRVAYGQELQRRLNKGVHCANCRSSITLSALDGPASAYDWVHAGGSKVCPDVPTKVDK